MQEFQEPFQLLQPTIGKQALTLKALKAQAKKLCELTKNPGKTMARDLFMVSYRIFCWGRVGGKCCHARGLGQYANGNHDF